MRDFSIGAAIDVFDNAVADARAKKLYPQSWIDGFVQHSFLVAYCAEVIAASTSTLHPETAYALGVLHDIGKMLNKDDDDHFHGIEGYHYMKNLGWQKAAEVCLAHTFLDKTIDEDEFCGYGIKNLSILKEYIQDVEFDGYITLIQLSDLLVNVYKHDTIRERMIYIKNNHGVNVKGKYKKAMAIKKRFDTLCGCNVYDLLGIKQ